MAGTGIHFGDGGVRRFLAVASAALALTVLAGCSKKAQVNYRITVEVDDNGVTRTGTGVWSVAMQDGGFPDKYTSRFSGEAIPVDLGSKGTLFVLIAERSLDGHPGANGLGIYGRHLFGDIARRNRGEPQKRLDPVSETKDFAAMVGKTATLDCANPPTEFTPCPFMVRFGDERDPTSVVAVDPNNLAATYGVGVKLKPIKVTITGDDVTVGIEKRFVWLLDSSVMDNPGWATLPLESRRVINGMASGTLGERK